VKRRAFLFALATLGGALGLGRARSAARNGPDAKAREAYVLDLARSLDGSAAVQSVGRAYLEQAPDEDDRALLIQLVSTALREEKGALTREEAFARVFGQVRSDFEANRIARVRGWLLSVTEARLCALTVARKGVQRNANASSENAGRPARAPGTVRRRAPLSR
jgi:hypothetical protein